MRRVAELPPATEVPPLRGIDPTAPDPRFRLSGLLRPVRLVFAAALAMVALDALAGLAFPTVARYAVDGGITAGVEQVLLIATLLAVAVVRPTGSSCRRRRSSPRGPGRACSTCCGCGATRTCSGSAWTTTSASCPAGS